MTFKEPLVSVQMYELGIYHIRLDTLPLIRGAGTSFRQRFIIIKLLWLNCGDLLIGNPSKNRRMPLFAACTRYSLVKGERIVRFVLTARLRDLGRALSFIFILVLMWGIFCFFPMWDFPHNTQTYLNCALVVFWPKVRHQCLSISTPLDLTTPHIWRLQSLEA